MNHRLAVDLGERSYPIIIGSGLLGADRLRPHLDGRQVLVVSNETIAPLYLDKVLADLHGYRVGQHILRDGEPFKTWDELGGILAALAGIRASRDAVIIALGGGVVGDMSGFAASVWMRGIEFLQIPTTLLAMVDSSVGGKTGVNLPEGKNLVGAFHQPRAVIADLDTLNTLPEREFRAGLAEAIKYGAIVDAGLFEWYERHLDAILARDPMALLEVVKTSCTIKADIVKRDEHEHGDRALLNFGHTFGHAIETLGGYSQHLHGEAVALGMVLAARLSTALKRAPAADSGRLTALIERLGMPTTLPPGFSPAAMVAAMRLDKKVLNDTLRLILWRGIGQADIVPGVPEADILATLSA
ncbi:3-dehydroquinate synthase [Ahniella affigens]|uniref:3-dehydroquinate synthase n=1 Tax=Ahniella affigens TaxID=2021234 RepID=A0A2P1PRN3_9GAMM|nr:3-dehydroquinate synthase [Ahniella affigens]AVP97485.1 3-dehydroquinate synthase [Ahniella affigens]